MSRASTVRLARKLAALRPAKARRGRVPPPLPPTAIQAAYFRALQQAVCNRARDAFEEVQPEILADLAEQRKVTGRSDAKKPPPPPMHSGKARGLIDRAARAFAARVDTHSLHDLVKQFGKRTDKHQRAQFDKQLRSAIGVSYGDIEKPVRDQVTGWTKDNVDLVSTVPDRYFKRLRADVKGAYSSGMQTETLAKRFAARHDSSLNDARRIARDQVSKLNGRLNQERQTNLGVETYFWRGVHDGRERDCHLDLEGVECRWDTPPDGGGTDEDETGHPGSGIQCRCYSEPNLSNLIG